MDKQIVHARQILHRSSYSVFFTGAGISTPSGIPDFRSPGSGLWEKYDPYAVASYSAYLHHPEQFFDWIRSLYLQSKDAQPNIAHFVLAELEKLGMVKSVITQNIDGLHQQAGSKNVIELHGSARSATCQNCQARFDGNKILQLYIRHDIIPACEFCGNILKPDIILYEESLPEKAWQDAESEIQKADAVFVAGSSLETYPANTLPRMGVSNGAFLVIITLTPSPLDDIADVVIRADVTQAIPALLKMDK